MKEVNLCHQLNLKQQVQQINPDLIIEYKYKNNNGYFGMLSNRDINTKKPKQKNININRDYKYLTSLA